MIYTPVISSQVPPFVSIEMPGITYEQFINSLGQFNFSVKKMKLTASTMAQVQAVMQYQHFDVNGEKLEDAIVPNVDPYQVIPSVYTELGGKVLDSRTSILMTFFPNESIQLILFTDEISISDLLNSMHKSNFKQVQE